MKRPIWFFSLLILCWRIAFSANDQNPCVAEWECSIDDTPTIYCTGPEENTYVGIPGETIHVVFGYGTTDGWVTMVDVKCDEDEQSGPLGASLDESSKTVTYTISENATHNQEITISSPSASGSYSDCDGNSTPISGGAGESSATIRVCVPQYECDSVVTPPTITVQAEPGQNDLSGYVGDTITVWFRYGTTKGSMLFKDKRCEQKDRYEDIEGTLTSASRESETVTLTEADLQRRYKDVASPSASGYFDGCAKLGQSPNREDMDTPEEAIIRINVLCKEIKDPQRPIKLEYEPTGKEPIIKEKRRENTYCPDGVTINTQKIIKSWYQETRIFKVTEYEFPQHCPPNRELIETTDLEIGPEFESSLLIVNHCSGGNNDIHNDSDCEEPSEPNQGIADAPGSIETDDPTTKLLVQILPAAAPEGEAPPEFHVNIKHSIVTVNTGRGRDLHGKLKLRLADGQPAIPPDAYTIERLSYDEEGNIEYDANGQSVYMSYTLGEEIPVVERGHGGCGIHDWHSGIMPFRFTMHKRVPLNLIAEVDPDNDDGGDGSPAGVINIILSDARLNTDLDRNGKIEDSDFALINSSNPFRFWINDDDDDGDDKRSSADDVSLPEGNNSRDSSNNKVDGIRDLEDFFPVFLDIKTLLAVFLPGINDISYYLRQEDDALNVVFTHYTSAEAFDYLRGNPTDLNTGFGPALTQKAGEATVTKVTASGADISTASPAFFERIKNHDGGVLLVEASKATIKPLVLEVRKGSAVVAELKLYLKIDQVETMFGYYNLRSFAHGTAIASNNQGPGYNTGVPTSAPNDPFATTTNRKNVVFVHGYNVNSEAARGSAMTAFKRFYCSGSKAKFYAVLWRGDDGQGEGIAPAGSTPDYHRNVGHAWQQGLHLRDFLSSLTGDTAIMAHSLGNMVTQVALTYARDANNNVRIVSASRPANVKHYFAVDAAVPLEATYDGNITGESKGRMRHSWWAEYDTLEHLWPTEWHALFTDANDARKNLTWKNIFAGLDVGTNFYSSGEEVLANPVNDSTPVWQPLFFAGLRAWVSQEKHKGGNGAAAPFFRSWTAGWVENEEWYVPLVPTPPFGQPQSRRRFASEAQDVPGIDGQPKSTWLGVPTASLPEEPFFRRFQASESDDFYPGYQGSRLHAPIGDSAADDEACKLVTIAKCLGEAIPALSYAQGSNPATAFSGPGMGGNFNLNDPYNPNTGLGFKNGWPASRGSDTNWKHSDCLDVSYIFHFRFYDQMKNNGGL